MGGTLLAKKEDAVERDEALGLYRRMLEIRRFEEKAQELFRAGSLPGFIHLYIGEEAVAVGVCSNLKEEDYVVSTHRGHGHALAKGVPPREVMAELWGKESGSCGGRGGSMHIFDPRHGFLGTTGVVGGGIPIGVGAGFWAKLKGTKQISVAFFGDGAMNHAAFHEAANLAAVWELPVLFVCEDNLYATETPTRVATKNPDFASRAAIYGMKTFAVDGNDVLAVYGLVKKIVEDLREGGGPTFLHCRTYRTVGHHEGDPGTDYRTKEEVKEWRGRCPIKQLRDKILSRQWWSENELELIDREAEAHVAEAVTFARSSSFPDPNEVGRHLFDSYAEANDEGTSN
jgi:TPP-dependent pyruvate/acetoin dehydrogenase alpha subunit